MMERYKGYWITGSAVTGPLYTHYWHPFGKILKDGRLGSVVEVVRFQDNDIRFDFDLAGFAEFYGMELGRIFVDHCLPQP
jgi:hypothetical protein